MRFHWPRIKAGELKLPLIIFEWVEEESKNFHQSKYKGVEIISSPHADLREKIEAKIKGKTTKVLGVRGPPITVEVEGKTWQLQDQRGYKTKKEEIKHIKEALDEGYGFGDVVVIVKHEYPHPFYPESTKYRWHAYYSTE